MSGCTGKRLLRIVLSRLVLLALPFVVWFVWREIARRSGRPMGATPWAWLAAVGAALFALSLMAGAVFHDDNRAKVYVPAEASGDGRIVPGRSDKR